MSNSKYLADLLKVCSVLPVFAIMPAMADDLHVVSETMISEVKTMSGNHSWLDASTSDKNQSVWYIKGGDVTVAPGAVFSNNLADSGVFSTSINAPSFLTINSGAVFENNTVRFDGGAIASFNTLKVDGGIFRNNTAQTDFENDTTPMGGGAIALGSESQTVIANSKFNNNESKYNGGAIGMRSPTDGDNSAADLDILDSDFVGNVATLNGGAIYSTFYDSVNAKDAVYIADSDFESNSAQQGGAIYTAGTADRAGNLASMKIVDSDFENNTASASGGAIYNASNLTIDNSEFKSNKIVEGTGDGGAIYSNGVLKITNTNFVDNYATENADTNYGYGGAIFAGGDSVDIQGGQFSKNHTLTGGAVYISKSAPSTNITDVNFTGNWASDIGALGIFGKNVALKNLVFSNNYTTGEFTNFNDGGGALFLGAEAQVVLDNSTFTANKSAGVGGAIAMRSVDKGNNTEAKLDITNSEFVGNIAANNGGAIYSTFYNSESAVDNVYIANSTFENNQATNGGAIYNEGNADRGNNYASMKLDSVSFENNIAKELGGAIYNGAGGTVNISGNNTFTGNTANGVANDIWNAGALNIASGTTTIDGGILGNGALTIADGATLNIGVASVEQASIALDGTLNASLLDTDNYAKILGTVSGNGTVKMAVGAAGTYAGVFGNGYTGKLDLGDVYTATQSGGDIIVETRSVADVMTDTGLSNNAAATMIAMANHTDGRVHAASLVAQKSLAAGDVATIEHEAGKLRPSSAPVSQSVTTSNHSRILNLAAGRMIGRNGGDANVGYGAWAQGLFNKSKHDDKFNGYTRGVAVGFDANVDNVYTIGVGYAFNHSDINVSDRDTEVDSNTLFLYGQYKPNQWYINGTVSYTMADYTEDVSVFGTPFSADYNVDSFGAQAIVGRDFATGIAVEGGLRYLHSSQDSYNNGFGTVKSDDMDFLSGVAGLKYAFAIDSDTAIQWRPELRAAATYDFVSDDAFATIVIPGTNPYTVASDRLSRIGGEFGIGLTAEYKGLEVSLNYDLDLHKDYTSQTGMLRFRYDF